MSPVNVTSPSARQSRFWWLPFFFISAALVSLFAAPLVTTRRLLSARGHVADVVSPARMHANALEAALATEFAARGEIAQGADQTSSAASVAAISRMAIMQAERALDSLVPRVGSVAMVLYDEARVSISSWQREEDRVIAATRATTGVVRGSAASGSRAPRWAAITVALANVQRLEDEMNTRTNVEHTDIERLGRLGVMVPAGLVPLAFLALAAVAWTARRTLLLSSAAATGQENAERAMAAKSALMRGVTHDLKNPLGAACGYADLLADGALGPLPEAQTRMLGRLRGLLTATLDTVNDLVDLSRVDAGTLRIDKRPCDIVAIARECVDDYRASSDAAGLRLLLEVSAEDHVAGSVVLSDPVRVREVLGNLLSNAVKYTPTNGTVTLIVATRSDAVLGNVVALEVADTGPGIPDTLRERVFEEFFRVTATRSLAQGTGVGLSIARRVARLLGGDVRVRETVGGGATFTLLLPVSAAQPSGSSGSPS
ncbi:MAG: HAMP domain-containing histidine kinase [Gemmatimonadota bacterium]|nr:HAMP domain-containing histidine kinase [Gemmatimonadota bacterium]